MATSRSSEAPRIFVETKCGVCSASFDPRSLGSYTEKASYYMGMPLCPWCRSHNGRNVSIWLAFIIKVAEIDCLKPLEDQCNMGCKCITCNARMVLFKTSRRIPQGVTDKKYYIDRGLLMVGEPLKEYP